MIYVGTSGFSYKEWKGGFYPEKLPADQYLEYYSERFDSTELNNTFYRMPSEKNTSRWAEQVPARFRFALKLSQRITHRKRLRNVDEEMGWFFNGARPLGEKLGCILVQLPPNFRQDMALLDDFLQAHGRHVRLAFEFRHASWLVPETYQLLGDRGAALVAAEEDDSPAVREVTAPFLYARLRKSTYTPGELTEWSNWLRDQSGDQFVFFKHEEQAPLLAAELLKRLSE